MSEETQVPAFSVDQKLAIREAQLNAVRLQVQSRNLLDQSTNLERQIAQHINQLAADMKVDSTKFLFDMDTLTFKSVPVEQK